MIQCPNCNVRNHPSRQTCVKCGDRLPSLEEAQRAEEERRLREIAPHLSDTERQRIVEEESLRQHLRSGSASRVGTTPPSVQAGGVASSRTAHARSPRPVAPRGDMLRAAVLGLLLGLIGLGVGLIYSVSSEPDKKVFGRQLIAWSAAGMMILFVLFMYFPSLSPTPPALAECVICGGTGSADCPLCVNGMAQNPLTGRSEPCTFCNGVGISTCTFCNGTGRTR